MRVIDLKKRKNYTAVTCMIKSNSFGDQLLEFCFEDMAGRYTYCHDMYPEGSHLNDNEIRELYVNSIRSHLARKYRYETIPSRSK